METVEISNLRATLSDGKIYVFFSDGRLTMDAKAGDICIAVVDTQKTMDVKTQAKTWKFLVPEGAR